MGDKDIAKAAVTVVAQYGLQKVTMSDIAKAAGISRQSLYNAFPNKEEVLRASVRCFMAEDLQQVTLAWQELGSIDEKLEAYFKFGPVNWYDQIQQFPNASELMEGINLVVEPALQEAHQDWIALLADLLKEKLGEAQAAQVADFVFLSAKNAKYSAADRDQLLARLQVLKEMVVGTYFRDA